MERACKGIDAAIQECLAKHAPNVKVAGRTYATGGK